MTDLETARRAWHDWQALAEDLPHPDTLEAAHVAAETALLDEVIPALAEDLWQQERERRSLLATIRRATGGQMLRPSTDDVLTEYREDIPRQYWRARGGVRADEICSEIGFDDERDLWAAIRQEVRDRIHDHAEATAEAQRQAHTHPAVEALRAEQADERDGLEAAWAEWRTTVTAAAAAYADAPRPTRYLPGRSSRTPGWVRAVRTAETWIAHRKTTTRRATRPAWD